VRIRHGIRVERGARTCDAQRVHTHTLMRVLHVRVDVGRWACPELAALDAALLAAGSTPLADVPWDALACIADDPDHFLDDAYATFIAALVPRACSVGCGASVLVLTDSTVGHGDWHEGVWTGAWSDALERAFAASGVRATVDAVCGSGFVAGADRGEHFRARLAAARRRGWEWDSVLLVGGWNDAGASRQERVRAAASACVALAQRA
jgi:hypothetical protein